jgi:hypothetical protein
MLHHRSGTRPFSSFAAAGGRRVVGPRLRESEPVLVSARKPPLTYLTDGQYLRDRKYPARSGNNWP